MVEILSQFKLSVFHEAETIEIAEIDCIQHAWSGDSRCGDGIRLTADTVFDDFLVTCCMMCIPAPGRRLTLVLRLSVDTAG